MAAQAAHVSHELPDLVILNPSAKRWHSVRSTLNNAGEHLFRPASVNPFSIKQRRTFIAAAMRMAADTIEKTVKLLTLGNCVGIFFVIIFYRGRIRRR